MNLLQQILYQVQLHTFLIFNLSALDFLYIMYKCEILNIILLIILIAKIMKLVIELSTKKSLA